MTPAPVLYTFRRCPYAIRARMVLAYANVRYEIREVDLKRKPDILVSISPKATVPVLVLPPGQIIAESLEIMHWALAQSDPDHWLVPEFADETAALIAENDNSFKSSLDRYKYPAKYPEQTQTFYREAGEIFLQKLEVRLGQAPFLFGNRLSLADMAIFPFVRQFTMVDPCWFDNSPYPHLRHWLQSHIDSSLFDSVMTKCATWCPDDETIYNY